HGVAPPTPVMIFARVALAQQQNPAHTAGGGGGVPRGRGPVAVVKRATGIEPALEAWKASVQPKHFARVLPSNGTRHASRHATLGGRLPLMRHAPLPRASSQAPQPLRATRRSSTGTSPEASVSPGGGH